jgi:acyl dehydratase
MAANLTRTTVTAFAEDVAVTYTPASGAAYTLAHGGVFDRKNVDVNPVTGAPIQAAGSRLGIMEADLQAPVGPGDTVTVNGTVYDVISADEDGISGLTLVIQVQP